MCKFLELKNLLKEKRNKARSCWCRGVCDFAIDLLNNYVDVCIGCESCKKWDEFIKDAEERGLQRVLLKGAKDWHNFSWGGCALIYDEDIAKTLCTPSELKRTNNGGKKPNKNEEWLDVQARALYQAYLIIEKCLLMEILKNVY